MSSLLFDIFTNDLCDLPNKTLNKLILCERTIDRKEPINKVYYDNFLEIFVEKNFNWYIHRDEICKKINGICYSIHVLKKYVAIATLRTVYYTSFLSKLKYDLIFWGYSSEIKHLFINQKYTIRIVGETCN